jgi:hypothetical protein
LIARPQSEQNHVALREIARPETTGSTAARLGVALHAGFCAAGWPACTGFPHQSTLEAGIRRWSITGPFSKPIGYSWVQAAFEHQS